jgi:hypothetical protein
MNTWMPSSYYGYGMASPSFIPSMLDIFDPFAVADLSREINALHWIEAPREVPIIRRSTPQIAFPTSMETIQPAGMRHPSKKALAACTTMPQQYRIVLDCVGCDRQSIRTRLIQCRGQYHLIVECGSGCNVQGRQLQRRGGFNRSYGFGCSNLYFKRSYTLPRTVDCNKMVKYMAPNGLFVIEFPLLELPTCSRNVNLVPRVVKCEGIKGVSLKVPIPETVNPAKLQVAVKDRDLILRFENRIVPGMVSRVYCYTKVALPPRTNLNAIKCKLAKKRELTICAPLITGVMRAPVMARYHCINIERKLRHRITGKVPAIQAEPVQQQRKKQIARKPTAVSGGRKSITTGKKQTLKKSASGNLPITPVAGKKQQISPPVLKGKKTEERKSPSPVSKKQMSLETSQVAEQPSLPKVPSGKKLEKKASEPKIKKQTSEKKLFPETGMGKEKQGAEFQLGPSGERPSGVETKTPRRVSGSEVLHQIFSSSSSSGQQQQGRKSPEYPSGQNPSA